MSQQPVDRDDEHDGQHDQDEGASRVPPEGVPQEIVRDSPVHAIR
jgi:hypothetical protein